MVEIINWLNDSKYIKSLSPACRMCAKGSKLVLLVTGLCYSNCFYCPLSFKKFGKDRIFADEWELINEDDTKKIIQEAKYINARGAGITGGDPLIVWKRTKKYISILKEKFGSKFHIHLYTQALKNERYIEDLISVGLDEIRFHPSYNYWDKMDKISISKIICKTLDKDIDVAIEIPAIPEMGNEIMSLIKWSDINGVKWININELEFSEHNVKKFELKNYKVKNDISSSVKDSEKTANEILLKISKGDYRIGVHYCSCSFKDGIQLKNRIIRRAKNTVKNHEIICKEGTIIKGAIYQNKNLTLKEIYYKLINEYEIEKYKIFINYKKKRIETGVLELNKIASKLLKKGLTSFLIEEYPTEDGLEIERIPLPI